MGFLLTDFVQNVIEHSHSLVVFRFGMQRTQGNSLPNTAIVGIYIMDKFCEKK